MSYRIRFSEEADAHMFALTGRQKATVLDRIERQLRDQPTVRTRNRKPMDPDHKMFIAPWELRAGGMRVYYAVSDAPEPTVVVVAVGVKIRQRLFFGGKPLEP